VAPQKEVKPPTNVTNNRLSKLNSNKGEQRTTKKIPAVTRVAACINAETGVGPSIASGNHVCKPSCADLPILPINKKLQMQSKIETVDPSILIEIL